jgi:hypothetical protein
MAVSLHKLLCHSCEIIQNFALPIGFYTEEAQESRNKDNKNIRLFHTRKMNRKYTMIDQFNFLLVTSDPLISTISKSFKRVNKKNITLPADAARMAGLNTHADLVEEHNTIDAGQESDETAENDQEEDGNDQNNAVSDHELNDGVSKMEIDSRKNDQDASLKELLSKESNKIPDIEESNLYQDF